MLMMMVNLVLILFFIVSNVSLVVYDFIYNTDGMWSFDYGHKVFRHRRTLNWSHYLPMQEAYITKPLQCPSKAEISNLQYQIGWANVASNSATSPQMHDFREDWIM
jgi:hypothetical protein